MLSRELGRLAEPSQSSAQDDQQQRIAYCGCSRPVAASWTTAATPGTTVRAHRSSGWRGPGDCLATISIVRASPAARSPSPKCDRPSPDPVYRRRVRAGDGSQRPAARAREAQSDEHLGAMRAFVGGSKGGREQGRFARRRVGALPSPLRRSLGFRFARPVPRSWNAPAGLVDAC